jgi:polyisoprenoid-binding protein YceI
MSNTETLTGVSVGSWTLDPIHSNVGFEVQYLVGTFRGQFRDIDGQLVVNDDGRATLEGSARVASVDVKDEQLSGHLQSPDFFDAERFPEISFRADGIDVASGEIRAQGEITIKGVTKPVEIKGTITPPSPDASGNQRVGAVLSAAVDRTDFGVNWNVPLPDGKPALADEVKLSAELYFVKEA